MSDTKKQIISRKEAKSLGLTHYFTGKPCPKGHVSNRYVSTFSCIECGDIRNKLKYKGVKRHFVTDEDLTDAINSFISYQEFRSSKEYTIAMKRGFHDFAISVLGMGKTSKRWDKFTCLEEAGNFKTRSEFSRLSSGAYDYAVNNGILEEICANMETPICDADVCYLWGYKSNNGYVCKVGITSKRLGTERIKFVSVKSGMPVDFLWMVESDKSRDTEKYILDIGDYYEISGVNGWTEFRTFTEYQLANIKGEYEWNSVALNGINQE